MELPRKDIREILGRAKAEEELNGFIKVRRISPMALAAAFRGFEVWEIDWDGEFVEISYEAFKTVLLENG